MFSAFRTSLLAVFAAFFCFAGAAQGAELSAREQEILARANELLARYQANDQAGVIAMLDERFLIQGTNFDENIRTPADLRQLMTRDFTQWGSARFYDVREVDVRRAGKLATAYFVFTFKAAQGPEVPIRMCTTWVKKGGAWLLTQSSNALPPGMQ